MPPAGAGNEVQKAVQADNKEDHTCQVLGDQGSSSHNWILLCVECSNGPLSSAAVPGCEGSVLPIVFAFDAMCVSFEMKSGLKKSSLMANGKLLTIKSQSLSEMSYISTMTKFRAEQTLAATLTARAEWLNQGSKSLTRSDRSASCRRQLLGANRIGVSYALCAGRS
jgi:hypothetical protein